MKKPATPQPDTGCPVPLEVAINPAPVLQNDEQLLKDLKAVAHLQRLSPAQLVAGLVAKTLGPSFTHQVRAA